MTEKQSNMNENYEKLGLFYLGKHYDSENQKIEQNLLLYKSKHLVTHGICMGMTGSGKTGLCVSILEEAAIDIHLCINFSSAEEQQKVFDGFSSDGSVTMPLNDTFWGSRFGMLKDKFGINWMLNFEKSSDE